ncbi:7,8-dihydro-8-oxoguanine triphosphatase [Furfurilactobacillus curtus]|uniref:7,8-dihydro-8-oxoguanine triphosphatase n=2 Tax=Furfurilactobacillus curtus TaxID=1746200 RepID=A0ABQ5JTL6_9LACO
MAKTEVVELTNLVLVSDNETNQILVEDRRNPDWPGLTFPGGHIKPGESFVDSAVREVWEETGLTVHNPIFCGLKEFMGEHGRYIVALFRTDSFSGELESSSEGAVSWMRRDELFEHQFADGVDKLLKVFDQHNLSELSYLNDPNGEFK